VRPYSLFNRLGDTVPCAPQPDHLDRERRRAGDAGVRRRGETAFRHGILLHRRCTARLEAVDWLEGETAGIGFELSKSRPRAFMWSSRCWARSRSRWEYPWGGPGRTPAAGLLVGHAAAYAAAAQRHQHRVLSPDVGRSPSIWLTAPPLSPISDALLRKEPPPRRSGPQPCLTGEEASRAGEVASRCR